MKVIALLTGRGNNTLQDKNTLDILGHPVLYYPAHAAKKANNIDDWYCSSDDEKILSSAEREGYKRIVRPAELASPSSQHKDCIVHALRIMEKENNLPDICVVILANNVTIKSVWIERCIDIMKEGESITAVVPVYEDNDHHPLRAKSLNADGTMSMYEKAFTGKVSTNRQELPKCYFLSHNFWVLRTKFVLSGMEGQQPWGFMGDVIRPYFIEQSIDIHHEEDLILAQKWIIENYND